MKSKPSFAILASGRGSNCKALLEAVETGHLSARCVLVASDKKDAPVLEVAAAHGIPHLYLDPGRPGARFTTQGEAGYVEVLREHGADWIALAGFMRILGSQILEAFQGKIINIHPSLLPAFPGLDAQGQAWDAGVKIAGCTVHFVDAGVDTGPIILQESIPVLKSDTEASLRQRILTIEHTTYVRALGWALNGELEIHQKRVYRVGREEKTK